MGVFSSVPPQAPYYLGGPRTEGPPLPAGSPLLRSNNPGPSVSPNWAIAASVAGQLAGAYAGYTQARLATYEVRSQASAYGFRSRMLELDRRAAEIRAQSILDQGQSQAGLISLQGAQRRAAIQVSDAASGVTAGVGSAAEVQASERLMQAIDVYHVNLASVRQASAERTGGVGAANEALMARTSAMNLRRAARASAPEAHLFSGLADATLSAGALSNYRRS